MFVVYNHCYQLKEGSPDYEASIGDTCLSIEEATEYYDKHTVAIEFFEKKTKIDFSKIENYETSQMEWVSRDYVEKNRWN